MHKDKEFPRISCNDAASAKVTKARSLAQPKPKGPEPCQIPVRLQTVFSYPRGHGMRWLVNSGSSTQPAAASQCGTCWRQERRKPVMWEKGNVLPTLAPITARLPFPELHVQHISRTFRPELRRCLTHTHAHTCTHTHKHVRDTHTHTHTHTHMNNANYTQRRRKTAESRRGRTDKNSLSFSFSLSLCHAHMHTHTLSHTHHTTHTPPHHTTREE